MFPLCSHCAMDLHYYFRWLLTAPSHRIIALWVHPFNLPTRTLTDRISALREKTEPCHKPNYSRWLLFSPERERVRETEKHAVCMLLVMGVIRTSRPEVAANCYIPPPSGRRYTCLHSSVFERKLTFILALIIIFSKEDFRRVFTSE